MITPGHIRLIPFFHPFEEEQLRAIVPFFTQKTFAPGEAVLQQNKINTRLYFLVKGTVGIFVDEQFILDISQVGEVFGEMSLANYSTCTATVRAKAESTFLIFSFEEMRKSLDPKVKDGVLKNFYKGGMEILANKLMNANKRKV